MDVLYRLQLVCFVVTAILAFTLAYSRCQMRWTNARYELSRWLIFSSMVLLSLHYLLQMRCGFRASGDDVGSVVNILFYSPVVLLISMGVVNAECGLRACRRYLAVGLPALALIYAAFLVGWCLAGSLHLGGMLYVMLGVFLVLLSYSVYSDFRAAIRRRRIIVEQTVDDLLLHDRYVFSNLVLLCSMAFFLVFAMLHRPFLYVVSPLMLVALLVFILSFIGLGYNIVPSDDLVPDECSDAKDCSPASDEGGAAVCGGAAAQSPLSAERMGEISDALAKWRAAGGFRDPGVNMATLANRLRISRQELTLFFDQSMKSSFRIWLGDVRFQEAQRMLAQNPHYSNEAISVECGFSSHAHLYKIFRAKTGMTPGMYKESLMKREDTSQE